MSPTRSALASLPCALLSVVVIRSSFPSRSRRETTQSTGLFVCLFPRIMFQHSGTLKARRAPMREGSVQPCKPAPSSICLLYAAAHVSCAAKPFGVLPDRVGEEKHCHEHCRRRGQGHRRTRRTPAGLDYALLHGDVGALQLLR